MSSTRKQQDQTLPTPDSIVSIDDLSGHEYFRKENIAGPSGSDYHKSVDNAPEDSFASLGRDIRLLTAEIHNLSKSLMIIHTLNPQTANSTETDPECGFPGVAQNRTGKGIESNCGDGQVVHLEALSETRIDAIKIVREFWRAHHPHLNEKILTDLRIMFIDFVHYGRPARNIKGIRSRFNPSVSDDLSTTILAFRSTDGQGRETWQRLQWAHLEEDVERLEADVVSRERWDIIYQHIGDRWPTQETLEKTRNTTMTELTQFSYTEDGSPSQFQTMSTFGLSRILSDHAFGERWEINLNGPVMTYNLLVLIACRAILGHDLEFDGVGYCGLAFARRFAAHSPDTRWTKWCCMGVNSCHMQFHIRFFSIDLETSHAEPQYTADGVLLQREMGVVNLEHEQTSFRIKESRMGVAIVARIDTKWAPYSVVVLTDSRKDKGQDLHGQEAWNDMCEEMRVSSCGTSKGIAIFQVQLYELLREWSMRWNIALHHIERIATIKIKDVLDPSTRTPVSATEYTRAVGLLQVSSKWIREGLDDVKSIREDFSTSVLDAPEAVLSNWDDLAYYQNRRGQQFLKRIENKIIELRSLREEASMRYGFS